MWNFITKNKIHRLCPQAVSTDRPVLLRTSGQVSDDAHETKRKLVEEKMIKIPPLLNLISGFFHQTLGQFLKLTSVFKVMSYSGGRAACGQDYVLEKFS